MGWEAWLEESNIVANATTFASHLIGALALLLAAFIVGGFVRSAITRNLTRANMDETVAKYIGKLARWAIIILAVIASLGMFGVSTTSFAAVIGAAGLAVGLAFQGTLGNFASGVMLLVFRPYKVGDAVNIAGNLGLVVEIDVFSTILDTFDNRRLIVPNGSIFGSTIENITYHPHRRAEVDVGVSYSADVDRTREVLEAAILRVENRLEDPAPDVSLMELAGSSVNWKVRVWAKKEDFWGVRQATIRAVKLSLDESGIEIPFPQLDVHLDQPVGA